MISDLDVVRLDRGAMQKDFGSRHSYALVCCSDVFSTMLAETQRNLVPVAFIWALLRGIVTCGGEAISDETLGKQEAPELESCRL